MNRVLVINSGSSSLKYRLIDLDGERVLASGLVDRVSEERSIAVHSLPGAVDATAQPLPKAGPRAAQPLPEALEGGSSTRVELPVPDHTAAFRVMLDAFTSHGPSLDIAPVAIGHRVVHGGARFHEPTIVTAQVKGEIDKLAVLAPLHNPPNLAGIVAAEVTFPGVPQVAVFDTAFHQDMPPEAYTYAIDAELAREHQIRRYGFHGTSYQYVSSAAAAYLGRPLEDLKLIVLHVGNGASACAVDGGRSVLTSMGLTPLEGLMMGTRGGDIDPGVLLHLHRSARLGFDELDDLLNHRSGLRGLAGHGDIRDAQRTADAGDAKAALAIEVYQRRIRHYVGAYLAELGGADAIVFTAGVGENNAGVRSGALSGLEFLGIRLDEERNVSTSREARTISTDDSRVAVLVVPTNEELEIARQSLAAVTAAGIGGAK